MFRAALIRRRGPRGPRGPHLLLRSPYVSLDFTYSSRYGRVCDNKGMGFLLSFLCRWPMVTELTNRKIELRTYLPSEVPGEAAAPPTGRGGQGHKRGREPTGEALDTGRKVCSLRTHPPHNTLTVTSVFQTIRDFIRRLNFFFYLNLLVLQGGCIRIKTYHLTRHIKKNKNRKRLFYL